MQLSKQSRKVYEYLLKEGKALSVAGIGTKLLIAPADVYRLTKPLLEASLVEKSSGYPVTFSARDPEERLGVFLLSQTDWFNQNFVSKKVNVSADKNLDMQLAFVQGRDELMNKSATEIDQTSVSVDLLRSGHEMPQEVMRALVLAIHRGVNIRMLIQDYGEDNKEQVRNWQKNGISVKKTKLTHLRLMLYDSRVCYFMSYKHSDSGQDMGMKIVYPPFSAILCQYFNNLWQRSEKI